METPKKLFIDETLTRIPGVLEVIGSLKGSPANKTFQKVLQVFFHTIYGSGSSAGLGELVGVAKSFDDRINNLLNTGQAIDKSFLAEMESMITVLKKGLTLYKAVEEIELPEEMVQYKYKIPRKEVMVVDDDAAICHFIVIELTRRNYGVTTAAEASEAKKILEHYRPDLIILDILLPGKNGLELLKELRSDRRFKWTPILILSTRSNQEEILDGIKSGADDYITKPFCVDNLIARIEARITRMEELHGLSIRDDLTGAFSRSYFSERLKEEIERFNRQKKSFSIALCDLDYFKNVNDEYGHQVGDFVLQQFASFLYNKFRCTDTIGRFGGEEFIVLLPDTNALTAFKVLERLRSEWEQKELIETRFNKNLRVTFSAGISEYEIDGNGETDLIKAADSALYLAKQTGRNRIMLSRHMDITDSSAQPKIIVVDDSAVIRNLLLNVLKEHYQIYLAKNAEEALSLMQRIKPQLIIVDLIMPVISGLELIRMIKKNPFFNQLKIIALTSDKQKKTILETFQAGVNDYISKPFDNQELVVRIDSLLKKSTSR